MQYLNNIQHKKEKLGFASLHFKCNEPYPAYRTLHFSEHTSILKHADAQMHMHSQIKITGGFSRVPQPLAFEDSFCTSIANAHVPNVSTMDQIFIKTQNLNVVFTGV
jgi:hypothetical protein